MAVASNFSVTAAKIADQFEQETGHSLTLAIGSTGHHYAQIVNGAPYDIFLSADEGRPLLLEESGLAVAGSRFTYALGLLVLWSSNFEPSPESLSQGNTYRHLAIANPRFAPYGVAALDFLESYGLAMQAAPKIVMGKNVAQTLQFVQSGSAQMGLVSLAQVLSLPEQKSGHYWHIEQSNYRPIRQQAVLIKNKESAREFMKFLQGAKARQIILSAGYALE